MNTIDKISDEIAFGQFVSGELEELVDDKISQLLAYCCFKMDKLKEVDLPSVESITDSTGYYFADCENLEVIKMNNLQRLRDSFARRCKKLREIHFDNLTGIGGSSQFEGCTSLEHVLLPNLESFNPSTFAKCTNLKTASFPVVTYIGGSDFSGCSNLEFLIAPKCTSVAAFAFSSCNSLKRFYMPELITVSTYSYLLQMSDEINGRGFLEDGLVLNNITTFGSSGGVWYDSLFFYIPNLESGSGVGFGRNYKTSRCRVLYTPLYKNEYTRIQYMVELENLYLPNLGSIYNTSSSNSMLYGVRDLRSIYFPNLSTFRGGTSLFNTTSSVDYDSKLTTLYLPKLNTIGDYAFRHHKYLNKIFLLNNDGCTASGRFGYTNSITYSLGNTKFYPANNTVGSGKIYVPRALLDWYKSASNWSQLYNDIPDVFEAFEDSIYATEVITVPNNTVTEEAFFPVCTSIPENAFLNNTNLKTADFFELETVPDNAFKGCKNLEHVYFPNATELNPSSFSGCSKLRLAEFPNVVTIKGAAFSDCHNIDFMFFPKLETIYGSPFYGVSMRASTEAKIYIPNLRFIGEREDYNGYASLLSNCSKIKSISLPNLSCNLPRTLFYMCSELEKILIGGVCTFNADFVKSCSEFKYLILSSTDGVSPLSRPNYTSSITSYADDFHIYVPKSMIDEYRNATNWSNSPEVFRAMEDYPEICYFNC